MIRRLGVAMGGLFLLGGLLGFIPGVIKDNMYLGIFMVNTAHNLLHIASGTFFLVAAMFSETLTTWWFRIFGAFYAAMAIMGFVVGNGTILGLISNNMYDAWGHAGLALIMLVIGFAASRRTNRLRV